MFRILKTVYHDFQVLKMIDQQVLNNDVCEPRNRDTKIRGCSILHGCPPWLCQWEYVRRPKVVKHGEQFVPHNNDFLHDLFKVQVFWVFWSTTETRNWLESCTVTFLGYKYSMYLSLYPFIINERISSKPVWVTHSTFFFHLLYHIYIHSVALTQPFGKVMIVTVWGSVWWETKN